MNTPDTYKSLMDLPVEEQPRPDGIALEKELIIKEPEATANDDGATDVTVVTVVFNAIKSGRAEQFKQCLDSVQMQKGVRLEHLIIDGASNDGTLDFVKSYQNQFVRLRILSKKDHGIYDAMNRGLALAKGKYLIFLNSDDFYYNPYGLSASFATLEDKNCDFSYAPIRVVDENSDMPVDHPNVHPGVNRIFIKMEFSHQSVMIRREAFLSIRGFDLRYRNASDYDSILRLILTGHRACCVPCSFVTFRLGGFSCANIALSQQEVGTIFSRLYNQYVDARITPEEGLQMYLASYLPLELRKRLFPYFVSAFGMDMVAAEMDDGRRVTNKQQNLFALKSHLRDVKILLKVAKSVLVHSFPFMAVHPFWLFEFAFRYCNALKANGRKAAANEAFAKMFARVSSKQRKAVDLRVLERMAKVRPTDCDVKNLQIDQALPVRMNISPSDFWNVYGTYDAEPWGAWAPKDMSVMVHLPDECVGKPLNVDLLIGGYLLDTSTKRTLTVKVNGVLLPTVVIDTIEPKSHKLIIPADAVDSPLLDFKLTMDADFVPSELGLDSDTRRIGILFGGLSVSHL